jgi:hypothetical protein
MEREVILVEYTTDSVKIIGKSTDPDLITLVEERLVERIEEGDPVH